METFKLWRSLHGCVMFMLLATISGGSACEAPSSPQCFRRSELESVYICEWSFNTTESEATFDLYFNSNSYGITKFGSIKKNRTEIVEEQLIVKDNVDIWVEAHVGNSSRASPRRSDILMHSVKCDAPENILVSWLTNDLSLSWSSSLKYPTLAEVWFRQNDHPTEPWENQTLINTTNENNMYRIIIMNLLKFSSYQVQIRHRSNKAKNPLWSSWSAVITVPAKLEREPEVSNTTRTLNGTRQVKLTWKPMPHAASYSVKVAQSSHGCPCMQKKMGRNTSTNNYTVYVSYSAVNITVTAINAAGKSPQATIQVPAAAADFKICDKTLLNETLKRRMCLEFYELQDADLNPERVLTLSTRKKRERKKIKKDMKDFTRYLYFEHKCVDGKPQTEKMCLFYKREGVPSKEPRDFVAVAETDSASLSWKEISYEHQRGFITHYSLCSVKISSKDEIKECINISASVTKYYLKNLTPGSEYNISLAGVTRKGKGVLATKTINTINTPPDKPINVWLSFGLLFIFFFLSTLCTVVLKRIRSKILPPVPRPVIPDFTPHKAESEETWERKEEVHELTLHQLLPEHKSVSEESSDLREDWDEETDKALKKERSDSAGSEERSSLDSADQTLRKSEGTELERVDAELALLIYRNGLVFDVKLESV